MEYILFGVTYKVYTYVGNYATTGNIAIELISEDGEPSLIDLQMTDRIKEASKIMQLDFLDHLVIGDDNYYSILEGGE